MKPYLRYSYLSFALCMLSSVHLNAAEEAAAEDAAAEFVLPSAEEASSEVADGASSDSAPDAASDEEIFTVMPQFTVTTTQDKGYFSANTLAGTRTNQLIKNTPMTISVVNEDLMEDLNLSEISSLEKVVASIQDEGESFSNSVVRFRGLLTKNQLYEFMQRKLGQDSYNVERVEVIRGANSLVYGQAAPGGKANYLAKRAEFGNDETELKAEIGENGLYRAAIDHNMEINEKLAVRLMGTYYDRDYSQDFKSKTLDGQTLAISYRPTDKTTINLHLERYFEERLSPRNSYLDRTGEYGLTGILEDLPASPDVVKYLSSDALRHIINYNPATTHYPNDPGAYLAEGGLTRGGNAMDRIPQININSAEDLKNFYKYAGIDEDNFGYGSPDLRRERYGIFLMGDITHQFTDDLALKVAYAHEEYNGFTQQLATSGDLFLSATSRGGLRDPEFEPNSTPTATFGSAEWNANFPIYDGSDPSTMPSPYIIPTWERSKLTDDTDSIRTTLSWNTEFRGSKQQFIIGLDYDRRESTDIQWQQVLDYAVINDDNGTWNSSQYRARDYVLLSDYHNGGYDAFQDFNFTNELSPNYNTNANHSNARYGAGDPGYEASNSLTNPNYYALRESREAVVDTKALWIANQGTYMNGRLNTLLGMRFDYIDLTAQSLETQAIGNDQPVEIDETFTEASPSIGALFWLNEHFGVFANYAQSIESPTGWDINPIGESIPAETGIGMEAGIKFELMDGKLSGQLTFFDITKENDSITTLPTSALERLYPYEGGTGAYDDLLYGPTLGLDTDGTSFSPVGRKVAGIDTNSSGIELDVYYNPTPNWSLFLGYAFSDAVFKSGPKDPATGGDLVEDGQRVPGTSQHSANFTARYNFKEGTLKGWHVGANLQYRSKAFYNRLYADVGRSWRRSTSGSEQPGGIGGDFLDGRPDLFEPVDEFGNALPGAYTEHFDLWLSDSFETGVFLGWSGRLFNKAKDAPKYSFQFSVDNLFDERDLIASGNHARYTDGRRARLKFSVKF
ncbi:MAG: TonB-dependent siderophore receptor [Opitutaceae bacterium]